MDWRTQAACRDHDPEIWFPVGKSGPALAQLAAAKAICGHCPVQAACLNWSLKTKTAEGVWGGLSEDERRNLNRATTRPRPKPEPATPEFCRGRIRRHKRSPETGYVDSSGVWRCRVCNREAERDRRAALRRAKVAS